MLIPNMVVAEVFAAFDRFCHSSWDDQINQQFGGPGRTLDARRYRSARKRFRTDIHNGALFYQHDMHRYHVLALDLVSPIDKYRKFYRTQRVRSMGGTDLLIGAMALHLVRLHGRENVALLTSDRRMEAIFERAPASLNAQTVERLGLQQTAKELGFGAWLASLYPKVLDLERCSRGALERFFGEWPLNTRRRRGREPRA